MLRSTFAKRWLQWIAVGLVAGCAAPAADQRVGLNHIEHIVVIYAKNRNLENI